MASLKLKEIVENQTNFYQNEILNFVLEIFLLKLSGLNNNCKLSNSVFNFNVVLNKSIKGSAQLLHSYMYRKDIIFYSLFQVVPQIMYSDDFLCQLKQQENDIYFIQCHVAQLTTLQTCWHCGIFCQKSLNYIFAENCAVCLIIKIIGYQGWCPSANMATELSFWNQMFSGCTIPVRNVINVNQI